MGKRIVLKATENGLVFKKGEGKFTVPLKAEENKQSPGDEDVLHSIAAGMIRSGNSVAFPIELYDEVKRFFGGPGRKQLLPGCIFIRFGGKDYFILPDAPSINRDFIRQHAVKVPRRFEEREPMSFCRALYLIARFGSPKPRWFEVEM